MSVLFWPVAADADGANASVFVARRRAARPPRARELRDGPFDQARLRVRLRALVVRRDLVPERVRVRFHARERLLGDEFPARDGVA